MILDIKIATGSNPLNLKTDKEKEQYVPDRIQELCTYVAIGIKLYLQNRKMTKKEFSERTGISKWRLKRILDGNYGALSIKDMACISCELSNERDKATRKVLFEKVQKQ